MLFKDIKVSTEVSKALEEQGVVNPTKIQEMAIPLILEGKDVIGMSYTGSGKTVAFGVPVIDNVKPGQGLQVVILSPVRELAVQIANELKKFSKYKRCNIATVYGGVALDPQVREMRKADIVVSTPGRLLDHLNRRNVNFSNVNCFVLDEADKMVEMGFVEDIELILSETPEGRQILLFGATISNEIEHIKKTHMKNPVVAEADKHVKQEFLEQHYYNIPHNQKFSLLVHLIKSEETDRVMIFCSSRSTVEMLTPNLKAQGIKAEMIHGKMSQNKRLNVIERFNKDKLNVLVASAVAARGLDIKGVTHVFNYDLSKDPQEYVHRIGRTARAGEQGKAITLLSDRDYEVFNNIFDRFDLEISEIEAPDFPKLSFDARPRESSDGGNRRRFSGHRDTRGHRNQHGHHAGRGYGGRGGSRGGSGGYNRSRSRSNSSSSGGSQYRSREMTRRSD
ncbi:DEAD/DEAH box helicase [Candidatus Woesearchaeota archaeon]|jgi:superfamily II DNA/RNA helicase|nr:DEAD/DEAH box helicase [Candidatus Woesearchaeota archaeon]MBT4110898.1 DEAD/DEAH box helicase [Candidatus Woesearchaeota archaeon]MBT4336590.1 DEAD/DEAH box helicase [Candidatus Woesearchaeota archaeon]MBT4469661.1 DEAD/DEAH box helicase [Candidatus Woesearchaeota archaeon]MBT6744023.1 DEAD/DEAH box helicase [Candidatus Woesearchaeota archaeon]